MLMISGEKILLSAELTECVTEYLYIFLDPLKVRYNYAKFYHCRIFVTGFRKAGVFFAPSICQQARKGLSWTGLRFSDVFSESKKGALAEYALTKPTLCMYDLQSPPGQLSGFHFLTSLLTALIVVNFFISRRTMFQIWEPRYEKLFLLDRKLWNLGKIQTDFAT